MGILEKNITLRELFCKKQTLDYYLYFFGLKQNKPRKKTQPTDFQNHQKFETLIVSCSPLHFLYLLLLENGKTKSKNECERIHYSVLYIMKNYILKF